MSVSRVRRRALERIAISAMRRFTSEQIAAVGSCVDFRNKHDNWLTRMQTVKYWYAYFAKRNIEWAFKRILCLSGCLTAYRRSVLGELEPVLASLAVLGVPIKYGELAFLPQAIVMPVTYALRTPLALFTLDSGSWDPRSHDARARA